MYLKKKGMANPRAAIEVVLVKMPTRSVDWVKSAYINSTAAGTSRLIFL